jgi:3-deoxy-D-manno-octulosonate 8-phosphate phosphatase (KDO 8-P phosphatase)
MKIPEAVLQQITTLVFDIDGVFTDGSVIALESGEQARVFDTKDGYAVSQAIKQGFNVVIISGGNQVGVKRRLEYLGVKDIFLGVGSKSEVIDQYMHVKGLKEESILYMGDDIPDHCIMSRPGIFAACPADAVEEIKGVSQYISPALGGRGAVRDVVEQVLKAHNKWNMLGSASPSQQ